MLYISGISDEKIACVIWLLNPTQRMFGHILCEKNNLFKDTSGAYYIEEPQFYVILMKPMIMVFDGG